MRSGSCPQLPTPPPELSFSVRRAIFTSLPVVVALFLLPAIAFASPPDQLWIAGIYDGADGDDIVTLVYETAGVEAATTRPVPLLPRSSEISVVSGPNTIHSLPGCQFTRAPPAPPALILYGIRSGLLATFPAYVTFPAYTVTQRLSLSTTCCPRRIEEASRSGPLDGGRALDGIGKEFSPELHTGTGNFTVPLALPLAVTVSSLKGPFELGWTLSIPDVSRNTSKGIPRYDETADVLILFGAEDLAAVKKTAPLYFAFGDRIEDAVQEEVL